MKMPLAFPESILTQLKHSHHLLLIFLPEVIAIAVDPCNPLFGAFVRHSAMMLCSADRWPTLRFYHTSYLKCLHPCSKDVVEEAGRAGHFQPVCMYSEIDIFLDIFTQR